MEENIVYNFMNYMAFGTREKERKVLVWVKNETELESIDHVKEVVDRLKEIGIVKEVDDEIKLTKEADLLMGGEKLSEPNLNVEDLETLKVKNDFALEDKTQSKKHPSSEKANTEKKSKLLNLIVIFTMILMIFGLFFG